MLVEFAGSLGFRCTLHCDDDVPRLDARCFGPRDRILDCSSRQGHQREVRPNRAQARRHHLSTWKQRLSGVGLTPSKNHVVANPLESDPALACRVRSAACSLPASSSTAWKNAGVGLLYTASVSERKSPIASDGLHRYARHGTHTVESFSRQGSLGKQRSSAICAPRSADNF